MLEILMIELPGCMTRPHAWAAQYEPARLMSMTERNCSGVSRVAGKAVAIPALLTRTSTRPNSAIAASTIAAHLSRSAISVATARAWRSLPRTNTAVSSGLSTRRAASTTSAPGLGEGLGEREAAGRHAGDDGDAAVEAERVEHTHAHCLLGLRTSWGSCRGWSGPALPADRVAVRPWAAHSGRSSGLPCAFRRRSRRPCRRL